MGRPFVDFTNRRFGNLVVISYAGKDCSESHNRLWDCLCDCGRSKIIQGRHLVSGHTISCGCVGLSKLHGGLNKLDSGMARFNDLFLLYKKSALKRNREFALTKEQFYTLAQGNCYYCGSLPSQIIAAGKECNEDFVYNGIDRVDNTLGYTYENTRSCCKQCNVAKGIMAEQEFYNWLRRVALATIRQREIGSHVYYLQSQAR